MAEGFELVRTIRQHLRRGAALFEEGKLDEALIEANAALALDAQSLPAQALRDRIARAMRASASLEVHTSVAPDKPAPFVPHGVNAASWRGFEQRIQERRFRALLDTVNTSIVAGDAGTARVALEEARELRPDAAELASFEARVAALPVTPPVPEATPSPRIWMRAMGAAALLLIGVSMLIGLERMRPSQAITPLAIVTPAAGLAPTAGMRGDEAVEPEPIPVGIDGDDDSVPAIVTPEEPTIRPRSTTGSAPAPLTTPVVPPAPDRPVAMRELAPPVERQTLAEDTPVRSIGEVSDDFVARAANTEAANTRTPDVTAADVPRPSAPVPPTRLPSTTAAAASTEAPITAAPPPAGLPSTTASATSTEAPGASVVPAALATPGDQSRVEEVLRRYARAYDALDASAARAVWPSVNEKALARAFQDLASQNVSFDNCEIDIRGAVANASCRGQASYVVKVGSREPRTEPRRWNFELRRDGEAWKIENAETRRLTTSTEYQHR